MYPYYRGYPNFSDPNPYYNQPYAEDQEFTRVTDESTRRAQWLPNDTYDYDWEHEINKPPTWEPSNVNDRRNQAFGERQRRGQEEVAAQQRWEQQLMDQRQQEAMRQRTERERERRRQFQKQQQTENGRVIQEQLERNQQQSKHPYYSPQQDGYIPSFPQAQPYEYNEYKSAPPPPPPPPPPVPEYAERHTEAASTIQNQFRIHQSFRKIDSLSAEFGALQEGFHPPTTISFQKPSSVSPPTSNNTVDIPAINIDESTFSYVSSEDDNIKVPKLAYSSTNQSLNAYIDSLDKLLVKLDGVESWDNREVRMKRRNLVKQIEMEQTRMDRLCKESWVRHVAGGRYPPK